MYNDCPFCHHENATLYRKNNPGLRRKDYLRDIYCCRDCGILYPRPRFDKDDDGGYLGAFYTNKDGQVFKDPKAAISGFDPVVRIILKNIDKISGKALDIGAYDGNYCYILERLGFESFGIEPQQNAVTFAQSEGLRVYNGMFPDDMPEVIKRQKYQIISVLETIYYFTNLAQCLGLLRDMLEDDGYLLIKCHQGLSRYYVNNNSYFSRYNDFLQGAPTLNSMKHILLKSGFKIIKITGETSIDLLPAPLNSMKRAPWKRLAELSYRIAFQDITGIDINKADRLIILARRGTH